MAFVGMLNSTGTDRSAAFAFDQAMVPGLAAPRFRVGGTRERSMERRVTKSTSKEVASEERTRKPSMIRVSSDLSGFFDRYTANFALVYGVPSLCRVWRLDQLQVIDFPNGA